MQAKQSGTLVSGLAVLLAFQAAGAMLQLALHLQVPGSVLGFFLLWAALATGWLPLAVVEEAADLLLRHLLLLFTPVVVGVLPYLPMIRDQAWLLAAAIIVGTCSTALLTGWLAQSLLNRLDARRTPHSEASGFVSSGDLQTADLQAPGTTSGQHSLGRKPDAQQHTAKPEPAESGDGA